MSNGSGLFSKQAPNTSHLTQGTHGLGGEVADLRKDVAKVMAALIGVTVEEYLFPPAASTNAIMTATATSTSATTYSGSSFNGALAGTKLYPPRNFTVTTAGATATHAPATVTVTGLDTQNNVISETVTGVNGGAATYSGVKCFASFTSVSAPAAGGTDATVAFGIGSVVGLSQTPKLRAGQALPLVRREVVDGVVVTTGVLTLPSTNPPYGAYTPASAPATPAPAVATGTADITAGALYGSSATLDTLTLTLNVNGAGATTLTFSGTGNSASEAAMLAAITAQWPALTATQGGSGGNKLVLTTALQGAAATIVTGASGGGTAYAALGLTASHTYQGTGHNYCLEYEFDGTLQKDA